MPNEPVSTFVEKLWPLPSPEHRRDIVFPRRWIFNPDKKLGFDPDAAYLLYLLADLVAIVGCVLFVLLAADAYFRSGVLIDPQAFQSDRLIFPATFSHLIRWPALLLTIVFYLRIRLPLDIRSHTVPVFMHRALLVGYSKKRWLWRVLFFGALGLFSIFMAHIATIRFTQHFHQQENIWFVLGLGACFGIIGPAYGGVLIVSYACVAEKVVRFFPDFESDLLTMGPLPRNY